MYKESNHQWGIVASDFIYQTFRETGNVEREIKTITLDTEKQLPLYRQTLRCDCLDRTVMHLYQFSVGLVAPENIFDMMVMPKTACKSALLSGCELCKDTDAIM